MTKGCIFCTLRLMRARKKGIGIDIIEIRRFRALRGKAKERFLARAFAKPERDFCENHTDPAVHFAGTFAAKEAVCKALGGAEFLSIEIRRSARGTPEVWHRGKRMHSISLSISHTGDYAVAIAAVL